MSCLINKQASNDVRDAKPFLIPVPTSSLDLTAADNSPYSAVTTHTLCIYRGMLISEVVLKQRHHV